MLDFLVVRVMQKDSVVLPRTLFYGDVEFRSATADNEEEAAAIKQSCKSFGLQFDDFMLTARAAVLVNAHDGEAAELRAEAKISEIIDLKSAEFAISNYEAGPAGFVKNLLSGEIEPLLRKGFQPSLAFIRDPSNLQVYDANHFVLSLDNELSKRYRRSLHWSRNARHEPNAQLKILFHWFALEALIKQEETDNIEGLVRWFLGFPNGRSLQYLSKHLMTQLRENSRYAFWDRELRLVVDRVRAFRNNSVHSGFRSVDFTEAELKLYSQVVTFSASRCQRAVLQALISGLNSVAEFKDYVAPLFEQVMTVNDVHGNIIFSLDTVKRGRGLSEELS